MVGGTPPALGSLLSLPSRPRLKAIPKVDRGPCFAGLGRGSPKGHLTGQTEAGRIIDS